MPERQLSPGSSPATEASSAVASFSVIHLHRFGSCRGEIRVSSEGLAFVPRVADTRDGVTVPYGAFILTLDGDTLTLRASARTYRFRDAIVTPKGGRSQLHAIITRVGRVGTRSSPENR